MIHRYTVFGNPVDHSLSPRIHTLFAEQTQRNVEYTKTLATALNFKDEVGAFFRTGGSGCNVTAPFKQQAFDLCDSLTSEATRAGAVNTIKLQPDGTLLGHNTDGSGLLRDLTENHDLNLRDTSILIAGAGGATQGLLGPLLDANPKQVVIANRTLSKASMLARNFSDLGQISACQYEDIPANTYALVLNVTSMSLQGLTPQIPSSCIANDTVAYDLAYGSTTPFMQWAIDSGASKVIDGMGMLLEQAADSFFLWEEVRPKTRLVSAKL